MQVIRARNVHKALPEGLRLLQNQGVVRDSRNGPVRVCPEPVTTLYARPLERVLYWGLRDISPWLGFFEGLWMLGGRNDVKFVGDIVKRMRTFSDDGETLHGAYGHRWRAHFDLEGGGNPNLPDQLTTIIGRLRADPTDRRCVLAMWDPCADLNVVSKDLPCNTHIYFGINADNALDMTVLCRSNDAVFGAHGTNAVHFSMLQEYIAGHIGVKVGRYWQVSNNYHAYVEDYERLAPLIDQCEDYAGHRPCPYERGEVVPFPMVSVDQRTWDQDCAVFLDQGPITGFREAFFRRVVTPMWWAHAAYRKRDYAGAQEILLQIPERCDWQLAAQSWLRRREDAARRKRAADDGVNYEQ